MKMDIATATLRAAFEQPGCPLCRLTREIERGYIQTLLDEYVNDGPTRLAFGRSQGLCPTHAWLYQGTEQRLRDDGLKTAIVYESLGTVIQEILERYPAHPDAEHQDDAIWRNRLSRWLARRGRWGRRLARHLGYRAPGAELLKQLSPTMKCLVCAKIQRQEELYVTKLLEGLADPQFRAWFTASDGLCLPHLRRALASALDHASVSALIGAMRKQLSALLTHLRAYLDKHRWAHRPELREAWEEASWIRMVAFFAGEARGEEGEPLWDLRHQALERYYRRPREMGSSQDLGAESNPSTMS